MKEDAIKRFEDMMMAKEPIPDFCVYILLNTSKQTKIILKRSFKKFKLTERKTGLKAYLTDIVDSFPTKQAAILKHSVTCSEPLYVLKDQDRYQYWAVKNEFFSKEEILSCLQEVMI